MSEDRFLMVDGNEATTLIAHACNEVMAIYPITPSSTMGELADEQTPAVFHVSARTVATHALSIFGDYGDVPNNIKLFSAI